MFGFLLNIFEDLDDTEEPLENKFTFSGLEDNLIDDCDNVSIRSEKNHLRIRWAMTPVFTRSLSCLDLKSKILL